MENVGKMISPGKSRYLEIQHLLKESWAMGWPMILIMFFQFAILLTDVYVAGFLGTDVLAAVGYVAQLYWTLMIMANGLSMGTVAMVSQAYGAKSSDGVGCITANSLLVALCVSGVLTVVAQLYPASIVRLAGMPQGIQTIAESFLRVFSLVLVPTYLLDYNQRCAALLGPHPHCDGKQSCGRMRQCDGRACS